MFDNIKARFSY